MPKITKKIIDSVFEHYDHLTGFFRLLTCSKEILALYALVKKENAFLNDELIDIVPFIEILLNVKHADIATRQAFAPLKNQFSNNQRYCFSKIHRAGLLHQTNLWPIWESRTLSTILRSTLHDFSKAKVLNFYTLSYIMTFIKKSIGRATLEATHFLFQAKLLNDVNIKKLFEHATHWENSYEYLSQVYRLEISEKSYITAIKRGLEDLRNAGILDQTLFNIFLKYPPFFDFVDAMDILLSHNLLDREIFIELYQYHALYAFYDEHRNADNISKIWSPNPDSRTPQNVALGLVCISLSKLTHGLTKKNRQLWYSVIGSGFTNEIIVAMEIFNSLNILTQPLLEKLIKMHYFYLPHETDIYDDTNHYTKKRERILQHAENFKYTVQCLAKLYENNRLNHKKTLELLDNCESPPTITKMTQHYLSQSRKIRIENKCSIPLPLFDEAKFQPFNKHTKDGLAEFCKDVPRTNNKKLSLYLKGKPIPLQEVKKLEEKFKENHYDIDTKTIEVDPDFKFLNDVLTPKGTEQLLNGFHQSFMSAPNMILSQHIKTTLGAPLQSEHITTNIQLNHHDQALEIKTTAKQFNVYIEEEKGDIALQDAKIGNPRVIVEFHPDEKLKGFLLSAKTDNIELSKAMLMSYCNMRLEQHKKLRHDKGKCPFNFLIKNFFIVENFYIVAYQDFMRDLPENKSLIFLLKKINHLPVSHFSKIDFFIGFIYIQREVDKILQYIDALFQNKKTTISLEFRRIIQYYRRLKRTLHDHIKSELYFPEININHLIEYQKNIDKDISYLENTQELNKMTKNLFKNYYV